MALMALVAIVAYSSLNGSKGSQTRRVREPHYRGARLFSTAYRHRSIFFCFHFTRLLFSWKFRWNHGSSKLTME